MRATQGFLLAHDWAVTTLIPQLHRYHLDDDAALMSSLLCVERATRMASGPPMPWQGRAVTHTEIPHFYGKGVLPPFPKYLATDGREISSLDIFRGGK